MTTSFDPRTWIVWGAAMSLPPMLGRNPFPLLAVLIVAIAVRAGTPSSSGVGWSRLVRIAAIFAAVNVLFNVLTYHGGDRVIGTIPDWIPVFGGPITLNAIVFGLLNGLAIVALVLVWSTVAMHIDWTTLIRLAPPGLSGIAVSSSIAVTLVPKTIEAFSDIREVQAIRGFPMKRPRDIVPLVSPLLTLGLERSVTLAEALESRGFGGPEPSSSTGIGSAIAIGGGLTALAVAAFLVVTGNGAVGISALAIAALAGWYAVRSARNATTWRPTRYRQVELKRADRIAMIVSVVAAVIVIAINRTDRSAFFYEPYPRIDWPSVNLIAVVAIALLLVPLAVMQQQPDRSG